MAFAYLLILLIAYDHDPVRAFAPHQIERESNQVAPGLKICRFNNVARMRHLPCARALQNTGSGGGGGNEAEDAARLYRAIVAQEAKRLRQKKLSDDDSSLDAFGKELGEDAAARKRGGRATHWAPQSTDRSEMHPRVRDDEQVRLMRLKLKALDVELKDRDEGKNRRKKRGQIDAEQVRRSMEVDVNRLKLQLAEAKREADEKEKRAEDAESRVRKLIDGGGISSDATKKMATSGSSEGRSQTIGTLRRENLAEIEQLDQENRRKLRNSERAAAMDREILRNRAWGLETELTKQKVILETARREADAARERVNELESVLPRLIGTSDARIAELQGEVDRTAEALESFRKNTYGRLMSLRRELRSRLRSAEDEAERTVQAAEERMGSTLSSVEAAARDERLILGRRSEEVVERARDEKVEAIRSEFERLDAFKALMDSELRREEDSAEQRVQDAEKEIALRLDDVLSALEEEKRLLREEGRRDVSKAQAEAALEMRRLLDEMNRKLGANVSGRVGLKEELARSEAALREYEEERKSLRRLACLAGGLLGRKIRFQRKRS